MIRIDDLMAKVGAYIPKDAPLGLISKAYVYSARLHRDKFSPTGTFVLQHALEVSSILADFRMDIPCIVAGLLYDVMAEKLADKQAIEEVVGTDVAELVAELASLSQASFHGSAASRAAHMRQMILASTRDLRVILILLADRLQMLRGTKGLEQKIVTGIARETLAIYAPIAHRLGVHFFKSELEDLAFQILKPESYLELQEQVAQRISESRKSINRINQELNSLLDIHSIKGEVLGRSKNLYSIYSKMQRDKCGLDSIYDMLATRIILSRQEDCYRMLGLVHATHTPLAGKFKDYIALPKPNGYQSLHTCVYGENGNIIEIQIRTRYMHDQAEMGVAAHFIYKDGVLADEKELADVSWFRRLLENLGNWKDPQTSIDKLEHELESDQIFVLTPTGEVIKLPTGATPIDFAYAIHSQVGHHCSGARMNDRMISIRTPLENGTQVEIITSSKQTPNRDWLNYAVSNRALSRIRNYLHTQQRDHAIRLGREILWREVRHLVKKPEQLPEWEPFAEWMQKHGLNRLDDAFAAIGADRVSSKGIAERLLGSSQPTPPTSKSVRKRKNVQLVSISGMDNLLVRFAKCCAPVYGDSIQGTVTRGRNISIHRSTCHNLTRQLYEEGRILEVQWVENSEGLKPVSLAVQATTSMKDLILLINQLEEDAPITPGKIISRQGVYTQHLTMMVDNPKKLNKILARLNAMEGISAQQKRESA